MASKSRTRASLSTLLSGAWFVRLIYFDKWPQTLSITTQKYFTPICIKHKVQIESLWVKVQSSSHQVGDTRQEKKFLFYLRSCIKKKDVSFSFCDVWSWWLVAWTYVDNGWQEQLLGCCGVRLIYWWGWFLFRSLSMTDVGYCGKPQ